MEPPAEICENYQLKWSSYTSYIHSCIASSLVNEDSFADVALVTMDGHKIMAHRFVLSYASQYFNKALRFHPKVTTALPIMIVLPQSITYKALKILVKYMYSGEATVTKDILNVVLKAGDILKIKGLYREDLPEEANKHKVAKPATHVSNPESQTQKTRDPKSGSENQPVSKNPPPLVVSSSVNQKIIQSQTEATKTKEVQKVQQSKLLQTKLQNRIQDKQVPVVSPSNVKQYGGPRVLNFTMTNFNGTIEKENASPKKTIILNQKVAQQSDKPHTITSADAESQNSSDSTTVTVKTENGKTDNLSYLVIKDEPLEWTEAEMEIVDEKEVFPEESVKTESYDSTSNEGKGRSRYAVTTENDEVINLENNTNNQFSVDGLPRSVNLNGSDKDIEDIAELIDIPALIVKETNIQKPDKVEKSDEANARSTEPDTNSGYQAVGNAVNDEETTTDNGETTSAHIIESASAVFVAESGSTETQTAPASVSEEEDIQIIEPSTSYSMFEIPTISNINTLSTGSDYDSDSDSNKPVLKLSELKQFDLISFINRDMVGRALLQRAYKGILGNTDRDRLADLVITYFTNKYGNLNMKQLKILAKLFEQIPNEKSSTYFVDPVGKGKSAKGKSEPARGKLMDKSRNRLHLIRQTLGLVRSKKSTNIDALVDPNTVFRGLDVRELLNESIDNDILMDSPPFKKMKLDIHPDPNVNDVIDKFDYDMELRYFDIIGLINQDLLGQALLKRARANIFNNSDRDRLADFIVTHFINKYEGNIEINQLKTLAKLIELNVPFEKSTTYFIDPVHKDRSKKGKSEPARGKLTDKYRNMKHLIKTMAGQVKKIRGSNIELDEPDSQQNLPDNAKESQTWLRTNDKPESDVYRHWQDSSVIRRNVESEVSTIFEEWPILKSPMALSLVAIDFDNICKVSKDFNLETEFNAIFTRVCNSRLFSLNSADTSIFDLLQDDLTTDSKTAIQLYLLPAFIPARGRMFLGGRVHWKPSVLESRCAFMIHLNNIEEAPETIKTRIELKASKGFPANPYIIVIGSELQSITEAIVIVHDHQYKCSSVLEALFFCFKLYHVFRLKYPYECQHLWYLIQWEVFRYRTPTDAQIAFMNDVLSSSNTEIYTPLTCELCTETFTIPGEWVKHVQTHTDMLPAKRRRRDSPDEEDENASYPELQCDLCDKSFATPAEWVRHIQDSHTEFELSLSNRRNQGRKANVKKYKFVVKN